MLEGLNLNLEIRIRISVERRISSGRLKQFRGILRSCGASFMVWCRNNLVRYALAKESSENKSVGESLSNHCSSNIRWRIVNHLFIHQRTFQFKSYYRLSFEKLVNDKKKICENLFNL